MAKTFVLDTNVLLHSPEALEAFKEHAVVLPMAVIEELDRFKSRGDELGRNARGVVRRIDELRERGNLGEGVPIDSGGSLRILAGLDSLPEMGLDMEIADNRILKVAYQLSRKGEQVIFVSKDINARVKADALKVVAQDFRGEKVDIDELFTGYREVTVSAAAIDDFYKTEDIVLPDVQTYPNEFLVLKDATNDKHTALGRAVEGNRLIHLNNKFERAWNVKPRSKEQRIALELLMDPDIQLVTLVGQAGTGKTLLAMAAALECTLKSERYDKILVSRPIVPLGKDIGYLPGDKDEKLFHWMQPIFDNLAHLLRDGSDRDSPASIQQRIHELQKKDLLSMEAITYIRGRTIPRQFVIVDEAQNLTPHEVKTIISRAGEGTKMVLTGDPYQIDNPYLDSASNGLAYAAERLKTHPSTGHVTLKRSVRSTLAAMAVDLL